MQNEEVFDALTGDPLGASGWTVTRRLDGLKHHFRSLMGLSDALNFGTFGVKIVNNAPATPLTTDSQQYGEGYAAGWDAAREEQRRIDAEMAALDMPADEDYFQYADGEAFECTCCDVEAFEMDDLLVVSLDEFLDGLVEAPAGGKLIEPLGWDPPEFSR